MTSLHQLVAQASELATSVTSNMSASDLQAVGTEMNALVSQLTSIVNQKTANGNYLFGGTANQPPITSAGTYNSATNGDDTTIEVAAGQSRADQHRGRPLRVAPGRRLSLRFNLGSRRARRPATDHHRSQRRQCLRRADRPICPRSTKPSTTSPHMSEAPPPACPPSRPPAPDSSSRSPRENNQFNALTQTNLPNATVQLQQIQMQYQATLEAGTRILGLSILNYIASRPKPPARPSKSPL